MTIAPEPTALGLVAASQARLESAVAQMRGEINAKLDAKANATDFETIRRDLLAYHAELDGRVDVLESDRKAQAARELLDNRIFSKRQRFWGSIAAILTLGALWGAVIATLVVPR